MHFQTSRQHPADPVSDSFPFSTPRLTDLFGCVLRFLNKIDLLEDKLESGVRFDKYVVNYGNHPNDVPSVTSCEVLDG